MTEKIKHKNEIKSKKKNQETKLDAIPSFLAGSFTVHIRDHLPSNLGIVCGRGSFAALYSTVELITRIVSLTLLL